jgi:hypothetical protein
MKQASMFEMSKHQKAEPMINFVNDALFTEFWELYPKRKPSNPKQKAIKAWNKRIKDGYTPDQMINGLKAYASTCSEIIGTPYVMMAATFLGPDLHFLEEYEAVEVEFKLPADDADLIAYGTEQGYPPRPGESFYDYRGRLMGVLS